MPRADVAVAHPRAPNFGRLVAVVSFGSIAIVAALARSSGAFVATIFVLSMVWGAAPQAIDAFLGGRTAPAKVGAGSASVTAVIVVDGEAESVVRAAVVAAAAALSTVVVTTDQRVPVWLSGTAERVVVGSTAEEALNRAVAEIETEAVLVLSARAFVDVRGAGAAAALIRDGADWVIGESRAFNRDGFGPMIRERLGSRLRGSARSSGLQVWEPDATLVSTQVMRDHPFIADRPWAAVLRSSAGQGGAGVTGAMTLAFVAVPVDAHTYWAASVLRRRRVVADLADVVRSGSGRSRVLAFGLLLRELDGYPLAVWLLIPWLMTWTSVFAFKCPPWLVLVLWTGPGLLRWYALRRSQRMPLHPLDDMLALAFDAPGSVLALTSALTCQARPTRLRIPKQPLLVIGFAFAATTLVPLFSEGTTARRSAAVGLALTELGLLWMVVMRSVFQWNWARTTYRIPARLQVSVDGALALTHDVSPNGLAVAGAFESSSLGSSVAVEVSLDDGSVMSATGTVVDHRIEGSHDIAGMLLRVPFDDQGRWIAQLSRSATQTGERLRPTSTYGDRASAGTGGLPGRILSAAMMLLIAVFSVVATGVLAMSLIGYHPLIIRSGSMRPALNVGDVIVVSDVRSSQLAVGDIATIEDGAVGTLTHRVIAVAATGDVLTITTQGDANSAYEVHTMNGSAIVGREVWRVPWIGAGLAWAGTGEIRVGLAIGSTGVALVVVRRLRRFRRS